MAKSGSFGSARDQFHSVASTLDRTLVQEERGGGADDDETLAESIVDSMHSCAETLHGTTGDDEVTLHSCAETLEGSERDFDSPTPPVSIGMTYYKNRVFSISKPARGLRRRGNT